ncbi:MAG: hypothetical protein RIR26_1722 [Pseudomonadota bacterium]
MNLRRKKSVSFRAVFLSVPFALSLFAASGCRPSRNFYVIEEIRVPALQVLQKVDTPPADGHCFEYAGESVCQQYPLRPGKKYYLRMLALAPQGSQPAQLKFTRLQRAQLKTTLTRESSCESVVDALRRQQFVDVPLSSVGLDEAPMTAVVKQDSPMRVEEHSVSFTSPERDALDGGFFSSGFLPLFRLEYTATSGALREDKGAFTFSIVPEIQNSGFQDLPKCFAGALQGTLSPVDNKPPVISQIAPATGQQVDGASAPLEIKLSGNDTDADAKQRIQWYVSRGELENQRAAATKLEFSGAEPLTAVGIVRDLQGGVDFAFTTFSRKP